MEAISLGQTPGSGFFGPHLSLAKTQSIILRELVSAFADPLPALSITNFSISTMT